LVLKKIKVLIVDDSAVVRLLLTEIISSDESIQVVGTATDPYDAREKIKRLSPDVITLDVEMPKMDGLTFLSNLMRLRPMPVVMISTLTEKGSDITYQALSLGAVDFITKPKSNLMGTLEDYRDEIVAKIKAAAQSNLGALSHVHEARPIKLDGALSGKIQLIAMGASTGGTEAIKHILRGLPEGLPPIVIAQHIPDVFSTSYAQRLNSLCDITVIELRERQILKPGFAYLAPGDDHLLVEKEGRQLYGWVEKTEPVNRHRPSVDVLFNSVAQACGKTALGIILTGMGGDGAQGLKNIKEAGGLTIAQDEASSVVWGMPGRAVALGAAMKIMPLDKIAEAIVRMV
jgi:two-component system chemotaxis response regulator CheB